MKPGTELCWELLRAAGTGLVGTSSPAARSIWVFCLVLPSLLLSCPARVPPKPPAWKSGSFQKISEREGQSLRKQGVGDGGWIEQQVE